MWKKVFTQCSVERWSGPELSFLGLLHLSSSSLKAMLMMAMMVKEIMERTMMIETV